MGGFALVRSGAVKTILRLFAVLLTALLALALVRQTAFAKTYVITDGDRVVTYTTFATDPAEVLDQAGLTLEQYDTYTTQTGEGVEEITICRSQRVTVDYHGEEMTVTTFGETAGELLSRLNLEVGEYDVLSHAPEAQTSDGMVLRVDSVIKTRETYTAAIPHTITYCNDATIPAGIQEVLTLGADGELLCTADVLYVNGEEVERAVLSETVTRAPVAEVIAVGTGYLRIEGAFYLGIGILFLLYGYFRAVNRPAVSVVLTVCSLGTRVALAYALSALPALGVTGIWMAIPIGWFLADLVGILLWRREDRQSRCPPPAERPYR